MENNRKEIFPDTAQGSRIAYFLPAVTALPCFIVFLFTSQLHLSDDVQVISGQLLLAHLVLVIFQIPISIYWGFSVFKVHCRLKELTDGQYPIGPFKALLAVFAPIPITMFCAIAVLFSRFMLDIILSRMFNLTIYHEDTLQFAYKCAIFATATIPIWLCTFAGWQQWNVLRNLLRYISPDKRNWGLTVLTPLILIAPPVVLVASADFSEPKEIWWTLQLPILVLIWASCLFVRIIFGNLVSSLRRKETQC